MKKLWKLILKNGYTICIDLCVAGIFGCSIGLLIHGTDVHPYDFWTRVVAIPTFIFMGIVIRIKQKENSN